MPTIRDVARASRVSPATVSNVLNNADVVHPETRERVLRVMRKLNYRPSAIAQKLAGKRLNILGVVFAYGDIHGFSGGYYALLMDGILRAAVPLHQNTLLFVGQTWSDAMHSLPIYTSGHCDGLVLVAPPIGSDIVPTLLQNGFPFALAGDDFADPRVSSVSIDEEAASCELTTHLIARGHRRIALLCGDHFLNCVRQRQQGFEQAHRQAGIPCDPTLILPGTFDEPTITQRINTLLRLPAAQRPTALYCMNDQMAYKAIATLAHRGLRVPEDMSLVGFDDTPLCGAALSLTTIRQPVEEIAYRTTVMLMDQMQNPDVVRRKEVLPTELMVRDSVASLQPSR